MGRGIKIANKKASIVDYIFAFILFYAPNLKVFLGLDNYFLVAFAIITYAVLNIKNIRQIRKLFITKGVARLIIFTVASTVYFFVRSSLLRNNLEIGESRIIQNVIPLLYMVGFMLLYANLCSKDIKFLPFLVKIALVQAIICIASLIIPPIREVSYLIYSNGTEKNEFITANRIYGICNGDYTYGLQIFQAIVALVALYLAITNKDTKYYILSVIILFSAVLNGRAGVVLYLVCAIILLANNVIRNKKVMQTIKILFLSLLMIVPLSMLVINYIPGTAKMIRLAVADFTEESNEGNTFTILKSMTFLPQKPTSIIFGEGYRVYGKEAAKYGETRNSDVGYINDIYMGGIIFLFLLYTPYIALMLKKPNNLIEILLLICFIAANYKGELFRNQILLTLLIAISLSAYFNKIQKKEYENE